MPALPLKEEDETNPQIYWRLPGKPIVGFMQNFQSSSFGTTSGPL
jgi:hypothetical protein